MEARPQEPSHSQCIGWQGSGAGLVGCTPQLHVTCRVSASGMKRGDLFRRSAFPHLSSLLLFSLLLLHPPAVNESEEQNNARVNALNALRSLGLSGRRIVLISCQPLFVSLCHDRQPTQPQGFTVLSILWAPAFNPPSRPARPPWFLHSLIVCSHSHHGIRCQICCCR